MRLVGLNESTPEQLEDRGITPLETFDGWVEQVCRELDELKREIESLWGFLEEESEDDQAE